METVQPDHPQLDLLFAIEGDASDEATEAMRRAVDRLAGSRSWTIAPPEFVDEEDDSSCTQPDDVPIRTVGGFVKLYSGFPPWGERLPTRVDRRQLEEARAIIDAMAELSAAVHVDIVFEYAGEAIGRIEGGAPDDSLTDGLIGEWERVLRERETRA